MKNEQKSVSDGESGSLGLKSGPRKIKNSLTFQKLLISVLKNPTDISKTPPDQKVGTTIKIALNQK